MLLSFLIVSALASSGTILKMSGIGSARHGGKFQQLLAEATPVAPATKMWPCKPKTAGSYASALLEIIKYPATNFDIELLLLENENSRVCTIIRYIFKIRM